MNISFRIYNKYCSKYKCTQAHKNSHVNMGIIQTASSNSELLERRRGRERDRSRQGPVFEASYSTLNHVKNNYITLYMRINA